AAGAICACGECEKQRSSQPQLKENRRMSSRPWEGMEEPTPTPYLRAPRYSPDGRTLAFVYAGDIWFVDPGGGEARLVVSHSAYNDRPRFSPDGRQLAFTSRRSGNGDLYVLDMEAGET